MTTAAYKQPLLEQAPTNKLSARLWVHIFGTCLSGVQLGFHLCVIASVLTPVQRELKLCTSCAHDDESDASLARCSCTNKQLAVSICPLGAVCGALLGGILSDIIGRRLSLMATDVCFLIAAAAMTLASPGTYGVAQFFAGRAIAGLGLGAAGAIASAYIAELSPSATRGALVQLNSFALCFGCLLAYVAALILGDARWRLTIALAAVPAALQAAMLTCFHESPAWLASRGGRRSAEEARAAADALGIPPVENGQKGQGDTDNEEKEEKRKVGLLHSLCRTPLRHRRPLALAMGIAFGHAASGANAVLYYSRDVLSVAGMPDTNVRLANAGVGLIKFLGSAASLCMVDRFGRRPLLLGGSLSMMICHFGLAYVLGAPPSAANAALALGSLLLFILSWNLSWAGLMLTVTSELMPQDIRGFGCGMAYCVYWLLSFLIASTFESSFESFGVRATFCAYGTFTGLALLFVLACVPETNGIVLGAVPSSGAGAAVRST